MSMTNQADITGYLGRDVDFRESEKGKMSRFSVATTDRWTDKDSGEKKTRTEWHNLTAYGAKAQLARDYLSKGSHVRIKGQLRTRKWEKDGVDHYTTVIIMEEVEFLDKKENTSNTPDGQLTSKPAELPDESEFKNDNIPF